MSITPIQYEILRLCSEGNVTELRVLVHQVLNIHQELQHRHRIAQQSSQVYIPMSPELVQAQENIELARNFNHRNFLQNPSGTPLSCAIRSGSLELIRFLIEHGAVIEQMDFDGLLPLQLSISLGKARIPVSELFRAHYNQSLPNGLSVATTQNLLYWVGTHLIRAYNSKCSRAVSNGNNASNCGQYPNT